MSVVTGVATGVAESIVAGMKTQTEISGLNGVITAHGQSAAGQAQLGELQDRKIERAEKMDHMVQAKDRKVQKLAKKKNQAGTAGLQKDLQKSLKHSRKHLKKLRKLQLSMLS